MLDQIIAKLDSAKSKTVGVNIPTGSPVYDTLSDYLKKEGYKYDITPARFGTSFKIKTKWKKKS